ncbi:MAG: cation-transporting P-type ATPase, partial [Desulfobulbales bacterium]
MNDSSKANRESAEKTAWHALSIEDVLQKLSCTREGLSNDGVRERLSRYGPNRLPPQPRRSLIKRFFIQFH